MYLKTFSQCFSYVFIWTVDVRTLEMVDDSTFCNLLSLSLVVTNIVFKVLVPLKCTCIPLV